MAQMVFSNAKLWLAQYELTGKLNAIALSDTPDMLDNTVFGNTAKSRKKGLSNPAASISGFWDATADDAVLADFNVTNVPMTIAPISGTAGEAAYAFLSQMAQYNFGGPVGEMLKFDAKAEGVGTRLVRGTLLFNGTAGATANGTAFNLGAVAAGYKLYACLHVTAASAGDTLDVVIQSDIAENMADATTRITFTQVGASPSYQWATPVAGPILDVAEADNWWRAGYTIAGGSPSYTFTVFMAIVPD